MALSVVRSTSFYDRLASSPPLLRCYCYTVDLQGRLYLEDTWPKSIATCLKDTKFLNFFTRRIRPVTQNDIQRLQLQHQKQQQQQQQQQQPKEAHHTTEDEINDCDNDDVVEYVSQFYPFVSPCGHQELNFIRPADTPIVFHSLSILNTNINNNNNTSSQSDCNTTRWIFHYGGNLEHEFHPSCLAISKHSGRLYHKFLPPYHHQQQQQQQQTLPSRDNENVDTNGNVNEDGDATTTTTVPEKLIRFALIRSAVAVQLAEYMEPSIDNADDAAGGDIASGVPQPEHQHSGMQFRCGGGGEGGGGTYGDATILYSIPWLPEQYEPSSVWGMPSSANSSDSETRDYTE